ncbi:MAG: polysaccharide deacetylase family protein [Patescibacteria group bacterium]
MKPLLILSLCLNIFLLLLVGRQQAETFINLTNAQEMTTTTALIPPSVEETLGIASSATQSATLRIPILMYHYVEHIQDPNDTFRELMNIHPEVFEAQVKTLKEAGYTFLTMREVGEILDGKRTLPHKPIVLTFDDGYRDFLTDALPILQKYTAKSTVYVIAAFTGTEPDHMTQVQLEEVIQTGLVEIGAHTKTHTYLAGNTPEEVSKEIIGSKKMLEFMLNIPIVSFAYPFGAFDEQAVEITKNAGFSTAVTTQPGIYAQHANRYVLDRLRPGHRTGEELTNYLEGTTFEEY